MTIEEAVQLRELYIQQHDNTASAIRSLISINTRFGTDLKQINIHNEWVKETQTLKIEIGQLSWFISNRRNTRLIA